MKAPVSQILVVDDEPNIRKLLAGVLEDEGYGVSGVADAAEAKTAVDKNPDLDLVLLDVQLPDTDGLSLLRDWRAQDVALPVIMMSGHGTIRTAVEATRLGALDFIEKPIQAERLLLSIANVLRIQQLRSENISLRHDLALTGEMIGVCEGIENLREEIARTAPTDARVLITGENGTGKELVARALHQGSGRKQRPFIKVNCAAIPSELLESELFGHERGAFTGAVAMRRGKFELAQHGTILLDEIGDMNPTTQAKLLRVLEEREMERVGSEKTIGLDVRVFASTNQDIDRLLIEKQFREDLYHRLKVVPIHVLPLRERGDDVVLLAEHFLEYFGLESGKPVKQLAPEAASLLCQYGWPGNVRELRNLAERLVIMVDAPVIASEHVAPLVKATDGAVTSNSGALFPDQQTLNDKLAACERLVIERALTAAEGNIAAAARELGLDRANLHRKLKRLGLRE